MASRYLGAKWIPVGSDQGGNNGPVAVSWHEAVTTAGVDAIAGWVDQENSCHAFIGQYGDMGQYKDFDRVAYGVLEGNYRGVVTIETWDDLLPTTGMSPDGSHGPNDFPWTDEQCERIADVIYWFNKVYGIPIHFMTNTREGGHAPHRLGVPNATGNVDVGYGPDKWTNHPGKECCGDMRIIQLRDKIIPRARQLSAMNARHLPPGNVNLNTVPNGTSTNGGDEDMPLTDGDVTKVVNGVVSALKDDFKNIPSAVWGSVFRSPLSDKTLTARNWLAEIRLYLDEVPGRVAKLLK